MPPHLLNARVFWSDERTTVVVVLVLAENKVKLWTRLFEEATPWSDDVLEHGVAREGGEVWAELERTASEDTVLQTLDWLSDAVDTVDQEHERFMDALKQKQGIVDQWFRSQL
jgi:hypothetical protein